jgi:hypothetical protein
MMDTPADDEGAPAPATYGEERRRVPEPEGEPRLRRAEDELRARFAEELQEGEETQDRVSRWPSTGRSSKTFPSSRGAARRS